MNIKFTLLFSVLIISLSSCYQRMYFPDRVNSPGLNEALDAKLTLAVKPQSAGSDSGVNSSNLSPSVDIAFAPVNHLGIIASYRSVNNRFIRGEGIDVYGYPYADYTDQTILGGLFNGNRFDIGVGFFTEMGNRGVFEVYAGYGRGSIERKGYYYKQLNFTSNYNRYFIQPAIGFDFDNVSLTGGARIAINRYTSFNSPDSSLRYKITDDGDTWSDVLNQNFCLLEPFINFEVGYKFVKFNLQMGASTPLLSNTVSGKFPVYATLGVAFRFAPRYLK